MTTGHLVGRMYFMRVLFNLRNSLLNDCPHRDTEVGAYHMHDTNDGQILAMIDYNIGVLENKERLDKNENNAREHRDQSERESYAVPFQCLILVKVDFSHLDQVQTAIN